MFRRTAKRSSASRRVLERSPRQEAGDRASLRNDHIEEWREAARRVVRVYKAWSAASGRDRQDLYVSFVDALRCEERAAQQVERDASSLGVAARVP
jgi:hypothetical protein